MKLGLGSSSVVVRRAWTAAALSTLSALVAVFAGTRHATIFWSAAAVVVLSAWITTLVEATAIGRPWLQWLSYGVLLMSIVIVVLAIIR